MTWVVRRCLTKDVMRGLDPRNHLCPQDPEPVDARSVSSKCRDPRVKPADHVGGMEVPCACSPRGRSPWLFDADLRIRTRPDRRDYRDRFKSCLDGAR